jgi:LPXTG-motif cell wall-anchored protein
MWEFIDSPWFYVLGGVIVVALIGVFIFLRKRGAGDED